MANWHLHRIDRSQLHVGYYLGALISIVATRRCRLRFRWTDEVYQARSYASELDARIRVVRASIQGKERIVSDDRWLSYANSLLDVGVARQPIHASENADSRQNAWTHLLRQTASEGFRDGSLPWTLAQRRRTTVTEWEILTLNSYHQRLA